VRVPTHLQFSRVVSLPSFGFTFFRADNAHPDVSFARPGVQSIARNNGKRNNGELSTLPAVSKRITN
jgi:hypothetical protein